MADLESFYNKTVSVFEDLLADAAKHDLPRDEQDQLDEQLLRLRLWHQEVSRNPDSLGLFEKTHPDLATGVHLLLENVLRATAPLSPKSKFQTASRTALVDNLKRALDRLSESSQSLQVLLGILTDRGPEARLAREIKEISDRASFVPPDLDKDGESATSETESLVSTFSDQMNTTTDRASSITSYEASHADDLAYDDDVVNQFKEMALPGTKEGETAEVAEQTQLAVPVLSSKEYGDLSTSQDFMQSWPRPRPAFIAEQAERAGIRGYCRVCGIRHPYMENYVLCGGCGPAHLPAHRECLATFPNHRPDAPAEGLMLGEPCQEVDFQDFIYTTWLLDSRFLNHDKESMHIDDIWSTWFGVPHDQEGPFPQLHIYPRIQNLISSDSSDKPPRQYPSLISFVGDTGSGKSTLIRSIIRMLAPRAHKSFRAPVPGAASDGFDSTSSDVHLFADPGTIYKEAPLMFVDCEGFSGTDTPIARRIQSKVNRADVAQPLRDPTLRSSYSYRHTKDLLSDHENTASHRIDLKWGQVIAPVQQPSSTLDSSLTRTRKPLGYVDAQSRKVVVKTLYPRLLYAFSDVVCFVTTNSRAAQTILEEMFTWAKDGHEKTLNQRVRPGLVIVLNKMANDTQDAMSSVDKATNSLLDSFQRSTRYGELRSRWHARGRIINSAKDLILCYYHSFRVIAIPQHTTASPATSKRISSQIKVFYGEILSMSNRIRQRRRFLNMDLDVASLNAYLLQSVTTLARDYNNALDFHRLADGDSALPRRFSEHLLQLMSNMVKLRQLDTTQILGGEVKLIEDLIPYIAACIVAQVGTTNDKAIGEQYRARREFLVDEATRGLEHFRDRFWRCEATDYKGKRRCRNYMEGHEKGHQFESITPTSYDDAIVEGKYQASYLGSKYTEWLWDEISGLLKQGDAIDKLAYAANASGVSQLTGQRTCLGCLSNTPTNTLPCRPNQHGICHECIRRYSSAERHQSVIEINTCPLGCRLAKKPWTIRVKPKTAGARILVLDGGGIRGIVELAILAEIEKAIGLQIRIQDLFDLVIGTSTGGIVALGVFEKRWTLNSADGRFRSLATSAFSLRKALKVPIFSKIAEPFCDYKYTTSGIESTLKESLGSGFLFGQTDSKFEIGDRVKVGVVSCQEGRRQPCLIANYSRNPIQRGKDGKDGYDWLQREDQQDKDFQTWQAARATSAAQTLFQPYQHETTNRIYVDGAIVRNNPVRLAYDEQKRIWPTSSSEPDIIVSIGTGIHVDKDGRVKNSRNDRLESVKMMLPGGLRKKVETGLDMVEATLDCHREWVDFKEATQGRLRQNSHRLDVGLFNKPPPLDAVNKIQELWWDCRNYFSRESYDKKPPPPYMDSTYRSAHEHIKTVARRLLASLFYLEHFLTTDMKDMPYKSVIHCRLIPQSEGAISLLALKPQFRLREVDSNDSEIIKPIQFVNAENNFDEKTLSAAVEFRASSGLFSRFVDVRYQRRQNLVWEPIGGF
ncbi:hypothetical protein B0T17DRAFT_149884 [Bombardia bombarda]|uniref:PNPLA domain-containing protein n=1 Tax=Bombardia bombarda TaxID=252184 RepID=A0AA39X6P8_9PEZI|nr:hypothetical protein B0T17DRAFT_149884 [Bombardia bombarda]